MTAHIRKVKVLENPRREKIDEKKKKQKWRKRARGIADQRRTQKTESFISIHGT